MFPKINPTTTAAWKALKEHHAGMKAVQMRQLFADDAQRFRKFSLEIDSLLVDYSKNIITEKTMQFLLQLANECGLKNGIEAMFGGEKINGTEDRSVLHTALRNFSGKAVFSDGKDVMPEVQAVIAANEGVLPKNT